MDGAGRELGVAYQLRSAEKKGRELVVIEAPHAVRAGGLELVRILDAAHQGQVARQHTQHQRLPIGRARQAEAVEAAEEDEEGQLVAGAIVDARGVAERLGEVAGQLA